MSTLSGAVQAILRFAVFSVFAIAAIVGIFVAWWLVVLAALALGFCIIAMRFFGVGWSTRSGKVTLEGEYKIVRGGRKPAGRVIEANSDPGPIDDKNKPL